MDNQLALQKFLHAQESLVIQQSDFSLRTVSDMVENDAIDVEPHYQRRERWNIIKQSKLIESFILNVPVPPIYLSEDDFGVYSVIDGKQRITSIRNFLNDEFKLKDLKNFPELEGLVFSKLPVKIKNALSVRPYLRVVTLLKQSDPNLKYEVFLRLNTGGEHLKAQEIRNVAYSGTLNDLLFSLSSNKFLKNRLKIVSNESNAYKNMEDIEHILRFFTLYEKWQSIGNVLGVEMDSYMAENRSIDEKGIRRLSSLFKNTMAAAEEIWGSRAFNKPIVGGWREQLISPLYDAEMVSLALIIERGRLAKLIKNKSSVLGATRKLFSDEKFAKAVGEATNNPRNIKLRISSMYSMLLSLTK